MSVSPLTSSSCPSLSSIGMASTQIWLQRSKTASLGFGSVRGIVAQEKMPRDLPEDGESFLSAREREDDEDDVSDGMHLHREMARAWPQCRSHGKRARERALKNLIPDEATLTFALRPTPPDDAGADSEGDHSDNDAFLSARESNSDWYRGGYDALFQFRVLVCRGIETSHAGRLVGLA